MAIFAQNFLTPGSDTIARFNPQQDIIDFTSVNAGRGPEDFQRGAVDTARAFNDGKIVDLRGDGVSLTEIDGGTLISAGEGNSLFVANVTPDQLGAGNITVDGQAIDVSPDSDFRSILDVIAPTGGGTVVGGSGDERIIGSTGNDTLDGGAGDDTISGRRGDDRLDGGEGNDRLDGGEGNDIVEGGAGDDLLAGLSGDDTLEGGAGDDFLEGGSGDDTLVGGAGDDTLVGDGGVDTLIGGEGSDTFIARLGNRGADTISDFDPSQDILDLQQFGGIENISRLSVSEVDGGSLIEAGNGTLLVEGVTPDQLGANNVTVNGKALNVGSGGSDLESILNQLATGNTLEGGQGNDALEAVDVTLVGGRGSDTFDGGAGDDTLKGGKGNDRLDGGEGNDTLLGGDGSDTLEGGAGDDFLKGMHGNDTVEGGAGDDRVFGGQGVDTLYGGEGDDTLKGGAGSDTLTGGAGADTFEQSFNARGSDTITDFDPSQDIINLRKFGGVENISVSEVDGSTLIEAGSGSLLVEGVTPDQLGANNIRIEGQAISIDSGGSDLGSIFNQSATGNETLEGGAGDDTLAGGTGVGASATVEASVGGSVGEVEASVGAGVEATATVGDDTLEAVDVTLKGGKGDDTLEGGAGDDTLKGGKGDDTLEGGAGDDYLKGGKGDDVLDGGAGDDTLIGGRGDDTFIQDFSEAGSDTITDFNPAFDTIDFRGLGGVDSISVSEVDGGTLISAGEDKSLFVRNTSPEEFSGSIKINGEPVEGNGQFNLESTLTNAASTDANTAIGSALDAETEQGGAVAGDVDDIDSDATLTVDDNIEDVEGQEDEDQSTDVG